jgi:hypothetical protein
LDDESVEGVQMGRPSTILAHASDGSLPRASLISREGSRAVSPVAFADSDDGDTQEERTSLHD